MYGFRAFGLLAAVLAATLSLAGEPPAAPDPAVPDAATLKAAHARVGVITIRPHQIFDLSDPHEGAALYRFANALHMRSRQSAIRAQLLFRSGDPYDARLLEETERNLRQLPYIREPRVRATAWHDGVVDVEVDTYDVWTLQLGPTFSRAGGANSASFGVADDNILGYGKQLGIGWSRTVDRTGTYFAWNDPNVLGSHWTDTAVWLTNSDGYSHGLQLALPFYQLASTRSYGLLLSDTVQTDTRYRFGIAYDDYRHDIHAANIYAGWSSGLIDGRSWRVSAGLQAQNDEFATPPGDTTLGPLPANRNLVYPYLMLALVTDQFKVTRDLNRIARTEDLQFGWNGTLQLGWSSPGLGADRDAGIANGQLTYGVHLPHDVDNFTSLTYNTRLEHGLTDDEHVGGQETLYWRTSERTLFYFRASGDSGRNVDLDHYDLLGGDSGLRGYPLRYQMGTSRALMTVEERGYTPWSLLRLLDIGGAAFFDVGRTWGPNLVQEPQLGWLSDAGIGLRLGNNRSSLGNVIHIDLATPLNSGNPNLRGLQLLVSTQATY
jgi:outer membrane protein assembly factor BamA